MKLTIHKASTQTEALIPVATSGVKAGFPSPAQDYMGDEIDLNKEIVRHKEATFYVRVEGDSMQEAGIFDQDLAVVDKSLEPRDGDFVIAFIDGEFTIKQFQIDKSGEFGWLVPWNDHFHRIKVTADDRFLIWGVVTHVLHTLRHK